jgi:hypothetical protein
MPAALSALVMNPPRSSRRRRHRPGKRPSAAQLAARRLFVARFGGKKSKAARRKRRRASARSTAGAPRSTPPMAKSLRRRSRSHRRRHGFRRNPPSGSVRRMFGGGPLGEVAQAAVLGSTALTGFIVTTKVPDMIAGKLKEKSGKDISFGARLVLKSAVGLGAGVLTWFAGKLSRQPVVKSVGQGLMVGAVVNVGYDVAAHFAPKQVLPTTLTGDDDGAISDAVLASLGGGVGDYQEDALPVPGDAGAGVAGFEYDTAMM